VPFREAVINDVEDFSILEPVVQGAILILPVYNSVFGDVEMGYWGIPAHADTPQGPFNASYPLGIGAVTPLHRFWMMENILNLSIDTPQAPTSLAATDLLSTINADKFRILNHYQARFLLTDDGKIGASSLKSVYSTAAVGATKVIDIASGTFAVSSWSNSELEYDISAETNPNNGVQKSSDGTQISNYASGRVGSEGQNANWRIQGQDVPWIFAEIINTVNSDRTVQLSVNTSVDISFANGATTGGSSPFNNLNIYHAVKQTNNLGVIGINYVRQGYLPMNNHLENFVNSVPSGTWPNPPTTPSVQ